MDDVTRMHPRITQVMQDLDRFPRLIHDGETFEDQLVHVDGREFRNCVFRRCTLTITLGIFVFRGTQTLDECSWQLLGPTKSTFEMLEFLRSGADGGGRIQ